MSGCEFEGVGLDELFFDWFTCKKCGCLFPVTIGKKVVCPDCDLRRMFKRIE